HGNLLPAAKSTTTSSLFFVASNSSFVTFQGSARPSASVNSAFMSIGNSSSPAGPPQAPDGWATPQKCRPAGAPTDSLRRSRPHRTARSLTRYLPDFVPQLVTPNGQASHDGWTEDDLL